MSSRPRLQSEPCVKKKKVFQSRLNTVSPALMLTFQIFGRVLSWTWRECSQQCVLRNLTYLPGRSALRTGTFCLCRACVPSGSELLPTLQRGSSLLAALNSTSFSWTTRSHLSSSQLYLPLLSLSCPLGFHLIIFLLPDLLYLLFNHWNKGRIMSQC